MAPPCVEVEWTRLIITGAGAGANGFYSIRSRYVRESDGFQRRKTTLQLVVRPRNITNPPRQTRGDQNCRRGGTTGATISPMVSPHLVDEDRLLSVREVASVLGVSSRTVRRRIAAGMPIFRIGSSPRAAIRVSRADLAEYIATSTVKVNRGE